ncbi:MAG: nucleoside recognition protein [Lachnospiraceae bacterium]|nr:nucleoside recognition protein [Lachnospiraceae bacterium]
MQGNMAAVTEGALTGAKEAVSLCVTMLGVLSFWTGILEIASRSRLLEVLTKTCRPLITFLFPSVPEDHPAGEQIATNFVANFLGLGWAATPAGLAAMKELEGLNRSSGVASDAMCTFMVINMSSVQLLPLTIIAYRSQYGSVDPAAIVAPALVATAAGTIVAALFCKIMCGRGKG